MKKWINPLIAFILIFIVFIIFFIGFNVKKPDYICPNKIVVKDPSKCIINKESSQLNNNQNSNIYISPPQIDNQNNNNPPEQISCPSSCDDNNKCTQDYCDFSTDYKCEHKVIPICCGNGLCDREDECMSCFSDCYSCNERYCSSNNNLCNDKSIYIFTTSNGLKVEVPTNYIKEAEWFGDIQTNTLEVVRQIYGYSPKFPLTYRFVEYDLGENNYLFSPKNNQIVIPANSEKNGLLTLKNYYNNNQNESLLDIHELIHTINFAQCELVTYNSVGESYGESKLPLWTDEGLAMIMELWIPHNYGNSFDKLESLYGPQKDSVIKNFEDKKSNYWTLVFNSNAYGYEHARGGILLYIWYKYNLQESQIKLFVDNLFNACKNSDNKLTDDDIVNIWNSAVGRDDTSLFREVGIIK